MMSASIVALFTETILLTSKIIIKCKRLLKRDKVYHMSKREVTVAYNTTKPSLFTKQFERDSTLKEERKIEQESNLSQMPIFKNKRIFNN